MTYNLRSIKINKRALQLFFILVVGCSLSVVSYVSAQTAPEFMITWKAINYVPSDYLGKTFPSQSSSVEIGLDVIDKGRTVDLSKNIISWYSNNSQINSGVGMKTIQLTTSSIQNEVVRVVIADYNGTDLSDSFIIPVQKNEVVISVKTPHTNIYRNRVMLSATSHLMEARPFFFNVTDLSGLNFSWRVNGQSATGDARNQNFFLLDLNTQGTPKETELNLSVGISNLSNQLELGNKTLNFIVK